MSLIAAPGLLLVALLVFGQGAEASPLTVPAGQDGAGLGLQSNEQGRVWSDVGILKESGGGVVATTLGVTRRIRPHIEAGVQVPVVAYFWASGLRIGPGNITFTADHVQTDAPLRVTVGGSLSLPTGSINGLGVAIDGAVPDAFQHPYLWFPYKGGRRVPYAR